MSDLNIVGQTYARPWGWYKTLEQNSGFQTKLIYVAPGGRLSLQSHEKRAEHWVVVEGVARVTVNESVKDYSVNQAIYIPRLAKHRLENLSDAAVQIIEVQIGDYLVEDDITRYDDVYGRLSA